MGWLDCLGQATFECRIPIICPACLLDDAVPGIDFRNAWTSCSIGLNFGLNCYLGFMGQFVSAFGD